MAEDTRPPAVEPSEAGMVSPDATGLEAWIRQVLGLAGARASAFTLPLPRPTAPAEAVPADGAPAESTQPGTDRDDAARAGNPAAGPDDTGGG
ncbi:hypothetical protein [Microbispora amethystogenes]|uniref:Uncharacterized protein n=1 Tax=Microbispora amethystogenes TaxID=1427754 RepID=A0ABQ4FDS3_9ACTN|nr:hypothetical protein [Microbispora amethystogenes]GIH32982.1 hypothetical protein Mam01_31460 [Microbispora amethystogenes]